MRVAFAGTPEFALPTLTALARSRHELVGVLTQPDRPRGRGRRLSAGPVKEAALALGIPVSQPASLRAALDRAELERWRPDALVVVAYGLMLPAAVLELPRLGCINVHASLLPRWRGAAPIQRALLAGDAITGITIMQMDVGLDTGAILLQRAVSIAPDTTSAVLQAQLGEQGAEALLEALAAREAGKLRPRRQPAEGATYAPKIAKAEALIDWSEGSQAIDRKVRAFNPWPIAETRLDGEQLRIFRARLMEDGASGQGHTTVAPGTVIELTRDAVVVQCGSGTLALQEVQRAGRNRMPASALAGATALALGKHLG